MLTPEQAQKITDLRSRMISNLAKGLPSHEGIDKEELRLAISYVRGARSTAATKAAKPAKAGKAPAAPSANLDAFGDLD